MTGHPPSERSTEICGALLRYSLRLSARFDRRDGGHPAIRRAAFNRGTKMTCWAPCMSRPSERFPVEPHFLVQIRPPTGANQRFPNFSIQALWGGHAGCQAKTRLRSRACTASPGASQSSQTCGRSVGDRRFRAPQDDRIVGERWRGVLKDTDAGGQARGVRARGHESEVTPSLERRGRARRIEFVLSSADSKFVARPARSGVAEPALRLET